MMIIGLIILNMGKKIILHNKYKYQYLKYIEYFLH